MPSERCRIIDVRGGYVRVDHPAVPESPVTTVDEYAAAGATALSVGDNAGIANGDHLLAGDPGDDGCVVVKVNGAVTAGTSLTVTATAKAIAAGTPLRKVEWEKVQVARATTEGGTKTAQTAVAIAWSQQFTEVKMGAADSFWFARYADFTTPTPATSDYSDAMPADGYAPNTVREVIQSALDKGDYRIGGKITDDFMRRQVLNCEMSVFKRRKNWPQFDRNDVVLGTLEAGVTRFAMPTDINDPDTLQNVRTVRVRGIPDVRYITREQYDGIRWDLAVSQLALATAIGGTTVTLDSVADFEDTGSVAVGSDSVEYTGKDVATNRLTGCTGLTAIWPVGLEAFQGPDVAQVPVCATVMDREIRFPLPASADFWGRAVMMNYYGKPTYPMTDSQEINFDDPEMYHWYIAEQVELKLHGGTPTEASMNFAAKLKERVRLLLNATRLTDTPKLVPRRPYPRQRAAQIATPDIISWKIN